MTDAPVFSRRDVQDFTPDFGTAEDPRPGPRTYRIAPLTFREREAFKADLVREGGGGATQHQLFEAIRAALRDVAPPNLDELMAAVDAAEAAPGDPEAQQALIPIEAAVSTAPAYAALAAQRSQRLGLLPYVALRHALRGWDGPDLPAFERRRGLVPDEVLDEAFAGFEDELRSAGWMAWGLMHPSKAAVGNSVAPSPSSGTRTPGRAASNRSAGARGSSATRKSRSTRG